MVSMGATITADSQQIQAMVKPTKGPWLNSAKRTMPPATGNIVDNSAKVNAMNIIKKPPMIQARTDAGPVTCAA